MDRSETKTINAGEVAVYSGGRSVAILAATAPVRLVGYDQYGQMLCDFDLAPAGFQYQLPEPAARFEVTSYSESNRVTLAAVSTGRLLDAHGDQLRDPARRTLAGNQFAGGLTVTATASQFGASALWNNADHNKTIIVNSVMVTLSTAGQVCLFCNSSNAAYSKYSTDYLASLLAGGGDPDGRLYSRVSTGGLVIGSNRLKVANLVSQRMHDILSPNENPVVLPPGWGLFFGTFTSNVTHRAVYSWQEIDA